MSKELRVVVDIPSLSSEFAYTRAFFDDATASGTLALTPDEARTLGLLLELGAREVGMEFEFVEVIHT